MDRTPSGQRDTLPVGTQSPCFCLEIPLNNQWNFGLQGQRKYIPNGDVPAPILTSGDPRRVERVAQVVLSAKRP